MEDFSKRLAEAIKLRKIKKIELAERLGVNRSIITNYINGYCVPKKEKLEMIAKELKVNSAWLSGYDVPLEPTNEPNRIELNKLIETLSEEQCKKALNLINLMLKEFL